MNKTKTKTNNWHKAIGVWIILSMGMVLTLSAAPIKIMMIGDSITSGEGPLPDDLDKNISTYTPDTFIAPENRISYRTELHRLLNVEYTFTTDVTDTNSSKLIFVGTKGNTASEFSDWHEGHGGFTSKDILAGKSVDVNGTVEQRAGMSAILDANTPDIVLLHIGTNDPGRGIPIGAATDGNDTNSTVSNIRQILDHVFSKNENAKVFVARIIEARRAHGRVGGVVSIANPNAYWFTKDLNDEVAKMVANHNNTNNIKMVDIEAGAGIEYDTCGLLHDMNPYHYKDNNESYGEVNATYDEHPNTNGYTKMGQKWFTDMNASGWLPDVTSPVIILNGQNSQNIELNTPYVDMNATVTDNNDVNRTIEGSGTVDTAVEGTYTITYSATDVAGNVAEDVNRTVVVSLAADTTPPVITLTGDNPVNLEYGTSYTDEGATASDDRDGDITADIVTVNLPVDTNTAGTYEVKYDVKDSSGNPAIQVIRTVVVAPNPADDTNGNGIPDDQEKEWFAYEKATQTATLEPDGSMKVADGLAAIPAVDGNNFTLSHVVNAKTAYITAIESAELKTGFKEGATDDATLTGTFTAGSNAEIKKEDGKVIIEITNIKLTKDTSIVIGGK